MNWSPFPFASTTIIEGVHYFNNTDPRVAIPYTPYTYPHPLVGGGGGTKIVVLTGPGLAFGNVIIGAIAPTATLTVANQGTDPLTVTSVSYPTGFTGATTGFTVASGSSFSITVTFTPLLAQLYAGNITVNSDATAGTNTIACSGTGVIPTPPIHGHKNRPGTLSSSEREMAKLNTITEDENHQGTRRIFGVPTPYRGDEAVNKWYCDANAGTGGSNGILDGGHSDTDFTGGPIIDCGHSV